VLFVPARTPLITLLAKRDSDAPSAHHVVIGSGWGGGHTGNSARGTEWRRGGNIVRERGTARPDQVIVHVAATPSRATHSQLFHCAQAAADALTELFGVGEVSFGAGLRLRPHVTTRSGRLPARACRVPAAADFVLFVPARTPLITLLAKRDSDAPSAHHVVIGSGWGGGHTGNSTRGTEWRISWGCTDHARGARQQVEWHTCRTSDWGAICGTGAWGATCGTGAWGATCGTSAWGARR